ncbi:unnamed protein product [Eruca vesicaria subsp. sativa]|uniref:Uncharacterized protein n=1 Tax=Eruca vesicaria subsp. sativa TaxID=29727 RepID=A0ABC8JAY3_ERUVS|nr:unnamed protein product [Eruca vesicaria subsp. sativa]
MGLNSLYWELLDQNITSVYKVNFYYLKSSFLPLRYVSSCLCFSAILSFCSVFRLMRETFSRCNRALSCSRSPDHMPFLVAPLHHRDHKALIFMIVASVMCLWIESVALQKIWSQHLGTSCGTNDGALDRLLIVFFVVQRRLSVLLLRRNVIEMTS